MASQHMKAMRKAVFQLLEQLLRAKRTLQVSTVLLRFDKLIPRRNPQLRQGGVRRLAFFKNFTSKSLDQAGDIRRAWPPVFLFLVLGIPLTQAMRQRVLQR